MQLLSLLDGSMSGGGVANGMGWGDGGGGEAGEVSYGDASLPSISSHPMEKELRAMIERNVRRQLGPASTSHSALGASNDYKLANAHPSAECGNVGKWIELLTKVF